MKGQTFGDMEIEPGCVLQGKNDPNETYLVIEKGLPKEASQKRHHPEKMGYYDGITCKGLSGQHKGLILTFLENEVRWRFVIIPVK